MIAYWSILLGEGLPSVFNIIMQFQCPSSARSYTLKLVKMACA